MKLLINGNPVQFDSHHLLDVRLVADDPDEKMGPIIVTFEGRMEIHATNEYPGAVHISYPDGLTLRGSEELGYAFGFGKSRDVFGIAPNPKEQAQ